MTAIIAPKPRLAARRRPHSPQPMLAPPLYLAELPRRFATAGIHPPPRLMSPHLVDSNSYLPKTAVTCTPAKRRRVVHNTARTARRRQSARHECPFPYADGANVFDKLSWISQLHEETDCLNPWDIADLSQLPIEQPDFHRSSGIGPVRSRKSSLRSDPLSYGTPDLQDIGFTPLPQRSASPEPSPPVFPLFDREALDPRTPPPRDTFNPEDVSFFNLKPVLPMDDDTY